MMIGEKTSKERMNKGYLTVEATLSLTAFMFFILFIMNFGQVYRAQIYVVHGLLQTGKIVTYDSYKYSIQSNITKLRKSVMEWTHLRDEDNWVDFQNEASAWENKQYVYAVQNAFGSCLCGNKELADGQLKKIGLKDGIASINFGGTKKTGSDLEIIAVYDVQLPFAFFGYNHVTLHSRIVCGVWE